VSADDPPVAFEAYAWHVIPTVDGHNSAAVEAALRDARAVADKPSLICCKTVRGKGAPKKQGTDDTHGAALGEKEVAATRAALHWTYPAFEVPENVRAEWDGRTR